MKKLIFPIFIFFVFGAALFFSPYSKLHILNFTPASAFVGPEQGAGSGSGAIGVDVFNNVSIGTSTTASDTKLFVVASTTGSSNYAIRVIQPSAQPLFFVRDDGEVGVGVSSATSTFTVAGDIKSTSGGFVFPDNTSQTTAAATLPVAAQNVSAGVFGAGNFVFQSSLGIGTSTQVDLPQSFSVYGNGYFSGNIGIGTTVPSSTLHVIGSIQQTAVTNSVLAADSAGKIVATTTASGGAGAVSTSSAITANYFPYWANTTGGLMGTSTIYYSGGNIGIGTTTPAGKLHVDGGSIYLAQTTGQTPTQLYSYSNADSLWLLQATSPEIVLSDAVNWDRGVPFRYTPGTTGAGTGDLVIGQTSKNDPNFTHGITRFYAGGAEQMRIASSSQWTGVAIATTTIGAKLTVYGGATNVNPVFINNNNSTYAAMVIRNDAANGYGIYDNGSDLHYFAGNVGIKSTPGASANLLVQDSSDSGTATPELGLAGGMPNGAGTGVQLTLGYYLNNQYRNYISTLHNDASGNSWINFYTHKNGDAATALGTRRTLALGGSGLVGVGVLAGASASDLCYDTTSISGMNTLSTCSSARRYKENIQGLRVTKEDVFRLRPVSFRWKNSGDNDIGLIAEEVAEAVPELVTYKDGMIEGVKYKQLSVYLLDVVRNMDSEIKSLSARIGELEKNLTE